MPRFDVGVLGATGTVGQRLVERLSGHPWFRLRGLAAGPERVGVRYGELDVWGLPDALPENAADLVLRPAEPEAFEDCGVVFSALDRPIAAALEPRFAEAGRFVVSNSSALRMRDDVPLVIPELNPDQLERLERQTWAGGIVTNPNCSVIGLALALAPLHRAAGVEAVVVSTLQALSGAGRAGPTGLAMIDNVVPFIGGEEEKIAEELRRLFAVRESGEWRDPSIPVAAHCHRVPVLEGHLESVSVKLAKPLAPAEAVERLAGWRGACAEDGLPSAPERPVVVTTASDRPQTRLDRDAGKGMVVTVGRVRPCPVLDLRLVVLSHNTLRGAAGAALLNAELAVARGVLAEGAMP